MSGVLPAGRCTPGKTMAQYDFPLKVLVDCAEPRVEKHALFVAAGGSPQRQAWTYAQNSGIWRDPVTRRLMLAPLPTTEAWRTTTTGDYARLAKTDYTLTTSAAWVENHRGVSGNIYLEGNGTNERVTTATSWGADQPFCISVFVPGIESLGEQTILECGWGTPGGSATVSMRLRANGACAVYLGSTQIAYDDLDYQATMRDPLRTSIGLRTVSLLLMPIRRRNEAGQTTSGELLIVSDGGTALSCGFDGITDANSITAAGTFFWQVPIGRPSVQLAPLKFATSGVAYGPVQTLLYAPNTPRVWSGQGYYSSIGSLDDCLAEYELVKADGSAYSPDGTTTLVKGKVTLTGDGTATICPEASDWTMPPTVVDTDDSEEADITEAIDDLSIRLDEQGVATLTLKARLKNLRAAGVEGFIESSDRPIRVIYINPDNADAEVDIFRGVLESPEWEPAYGAGDGEEDTIVFTGTDRTAELKHYQIASAIAADGKLITDVVEDILVEAGFASEDLVLSTSTYRVPMGNNPAAGEWAHIPERGQTLHEWLNSLRDKLITNWWIGWVPTLTGYKFRAQSLDDLSTTPALTLYQSEEDAVAAGATSEQAKHRAIYRITRHGIPPEANQVIVVGQNPYSGALIISQANDTTAQTPTTPPSSRPVDWRGRIHRVLEIDPSVKTQSQANAIRTALADRVGVERYLATIHCRLLFVAATGRILWTGDVIRLYAKGRATYEDFRIFGMPNIQFEKIVTNAQYDAGERPYYLSEYHLERIGVGP